jgi:hypothetical protein
MINNERKIVEYLYQYISVSVISLPLSASFFFYKASQNEAGPQHVKICSGS